MRGKLGQVNFRKDFWDLFRGGKNWPIADRRVPSNDSRKNCGTYFGSSFLLLSKVAVSLKSQNSLRVILTDPFKEDFESLSMYLRLTTSGDQIVFGAGKQNF